MKSKLLAFYFGTVSEEERLLLERELLIDESLLIDYMDLKRSIESATSVPLEPSKRLWKSLQARFAAKPRYAIPLALGLTLGLLVLALLFKAAPFDEPQPAGILFDSSAELLVSSNVL